MISAPTAIVDLLTNATADGLVERKLVWFVVRDRATAAPIGRGVWDGSRTSPSP